MSFRSFPEISWLLHASRTAVHKTFSRQSVKRFLQMAIHECKTSRHPNRAVPKINGTKCVWLQFLFYLAPLVPPLAESFETIDWKTHQFQMRKTLFSFSHATALARASSIRSRVVSFQVCCSGGPASVIVIETTEPVPLNEKHVVHFHFLRFFSQGNCAPAMGNPAINQFDLVHRLKIPS